MALAYPTSGPSQGLSAHPTMRMPEAAAQTFKQGAVIVNSVGYAQEAGADPADITGIAQDPGTNLTTAGTVKGAYDGLCAILAALPHAVFEFSLDSAAGTPYTFLATDLGVSYGLTKSAGGVWYIDVDKTGGASRVVIIGSRDPVGTAQARVYAVFRQSTTIFV